MCLCVLKTQRCFYVYNEIIVDRMLVASYTRSCSLLNRRIKMVNPMDLQRAQEQLRQSLAQGKPNPVPLKQPMFWIAKLLT